MTLKTTSHQATKKRLKNLSLPLKTARFWSKLSRRERILLLSFAILFSLFTGYYGLYRPIKQAARKSLETAQYIQHERRALLLLASEQEALRALQKAMPSTGQAEARALPLRTILIETARSEGLILNRLQGDEARVDIWLAAQNGPQVFRWLQILQKEHHIKAVKASLQKNTNGNLDGQFLFQKTMF